MEYLIECLASIDAFRCSKIGCTARALMLWCWNWVLDGHLEVCNFQDGFVLAF